VAIVKPDEGVAPLVPVPVPAPGCPGPVVVFEGGKGAVESPGGRVDACGVVPIPVLDLIGSEVDVELGNGNGTELPGVSPPKFVVPGTVPEAAVPCDELAAPVPPVENPPVVELSSGNGAALLIGYEEEPSPVPESEDVCGGAVPVGAKGDVVFEMGKGVADAVVVPVVPTDEFVGG
jgi:hypothetical protein